MSMSCHGSFHKAIDYFVMAPQGYFGAKKNLVLTYNKYGAVKATALAFTIMALLSTVFLIAMVVSITPKPQLLQAFKELAPMAGGLYAGIFLITGITFKICNIQQNKLKEDLGILKKKE